MDHLTTGFGVGWARASKALKGSGDRVGCPGGNSCDW